MGSVAYATVWRGNPQHSKVIFPAPTLNGIKAARRILGLAPESKIIFSTQETSPDVVQEAMRLGAWGYVFKIYAARDLLLAIDAVLSGKLFVSSATLRENAMGAHRSFDLGVTLRGRYNCWGELRQFGIWRHERGSAAIEADENSRKYKKPGFAHVAKARKMNVHLGRKLCLVAGSANCA